ncbi:MAG: DUF433 domain-containing protein [Candidatus Omnitrophota bacterium]|jgi:uncharacterized protein (DUF433 family)|nr:MAG: DUF433 domain-containing protein [Candidatus Omnitrophota bacterium]
MTSSVDIGTLIVQTPDIRNGSARIAGTGVTVKRIVGWYKLGLSPEEIVDKIGHLSLSQVYAALTHYHVNQEQIEAEMTEAETEAEQFECDHYLSLTNHP